MRQPFVFQRIPLGLFIFLLVVFLGPEKVGAKDTIRYSFEWIELEFDALSELTARPNQSKAKSWWRNSVEDLIVRNEAEVVRTLVLNAKVGRRAKAQSVDAYVYPEQFSVPEISADGKLKALPVPDSTAEKNIGMTVELEGNLSPDGQSVLTSIAHTLTTKLKDRTWGSGIAAVEMPQFHEMSGLTRLTLSNRETRLVGSLHPAASLRTVGSKSENPRLLLFVTARFEGAENETAQSQSKDFLTRYEFFQTDLRRLNQWIVGEQVLAEGVPLRSRFLQAVEEGQAERVELAFASGSEGKMRISSVSQIPFPLDYLEPEEDRPVPAMAGAFEFWNVGLQIDCDAKWQGNGTLQLHADEKSSRGRTQRHLIRWDQEAGEQRWMEGAAEVAFPLFHIMKLQQPLTLLPGEVVLLGTMRPHSDQGNPVIVAFATME